MAEVVMRNQAAAKRQLDAAIAMHFRGDDVLATHTVAAAAFLALIDLSEERGLETPDDWRVDRVLESIREPIVSYFYDPASRNENMNLTDKLRGWLGAENRRST